MVKEQTFETVDGYGMVDIGGAPLAVGPVRSAKKVLKRTTEDLIRHATYALAIHGIDGCGGAAALNHDRKADDQTPIATFAAELTTWATSTNFTGTAGLGLGAAEIGANLHGSAASANELIAASAAGCLAEETSTVVIVSDGDEPALRALLGKNLLVTVEPDLATALTSGADAAFVRSKTGALDHATLTDVNVSRVVGLQPLTTTARGLAVAGRAGTVIVPDFVSAAGPYLAAAMDNSDPVAVAATTASSMAKLTNQGVAMFVRACELAEEHLGTWTSDLPFGRPLAP